MEELESEFLHNLNRKVEEFEEHIAYNVENPELSDRIIKIIALIKG